MKARDVMTDHQTVGLDANAVEAARLLVAHSRAGLIVVDDVEHPVAVLPGPQVLRFLIPAYIQDDPTLARVVDEEFTAKATAGLEQKTVRELLRDHHGPLPLVRPDAGLLEVAGVMAAERSPIVAVVDGPGEKSRMLGAITLDALLAALLPATATGTS